MAAFGARVFVKDGGEAIFCGALPEAGLGIAVKCDDGAIRAAEVMTAAVIVRFGALSGAEQAAMERFVHPTLRNWNGIAIGVMRPTEALMPRGT